MGVYLVTCHCVSSCFFGYQMWVFLSDKSLFVWTVFGCQTQVVEIFSHTLSLRIFCQCWFNRRRIKEMKLWWNIVSLWLPGSFGLTASDKTAETSINISSLLKTHSSSSCSQRGLLSLCSDLENTISSTLKMHRVSPGKPKLPGIHRSVYTVYNIQGHRILDILIWAVCILIWGELSASACPRHLITSAWAQTHVSLLKSLRRGTFVHLASTFWQAALWIFASPPGRRGGSSGSPSDGPTPAGRGEVTEGRG